MNTAFFNQNHIEFFEDGGNAYAIENGTTTQVQPGDKYFELVSGLMSTPRHIPSSEDVLQYISDNFSGFNQTADIVDGEVADHDGAKAALVNGAKITPREREVIGHISHGMADKQVADVLHISTLTVSKILQNIREKIHATSKYHIVSLSFNAGLI